MKIVTVLAAVLLLGGCASSEHQWVVDWDYVERVEKTAMLQGINPESVVWVNYPRKRVPITEDEADEVEEP